MRKPLALLLAAGVAFSALQPPPPKPGPKDLCPVCGMRVATYPTWLATLVWLDGRATHFDGAKDQFKFLQAPASFLPGSTRAQVRDLYVTEYYGLKRIRAETAWYVVGSDVLGPMGHDLVALESQEDAADFLKDHKGKRILRFDQVTRDILAGLDSGRF